MHEHWWSFCFTSPKKHTWRKVIIHSTLQIKLIKNTNFPLIILFPSFLCCHTLKLVVFNITHKNKCIFFVSAPKYKRVSSFVNILYARSISASYNICHCLSKSILVYFKSKYISLFGNTCRVGIWVQQYSSLIYEMENDR